MILRIKLKASGPSKRTSVNDCHRLTTSHAEMSLHNIPTYMDIVACFRIVRVRS